VLKYVHIYARLFRHLNKIRSGVGTNHIQVTTVMEESTEHSCAASNIKNCYVFGKLKAMFLLCLIDGLSDSLLLVTKFSDAAHVLIDFGVHLVVKFNKCFCFVFVFSILNCQVKGSALTFNIFNHKILLSLQTS